MRNLKDCGIEWIGKIPDDWSIIRNKNAFMCSKELLGEKSELTQLLSLTTRGIKKKDINNAEGKLPESFDTYQFVKENDIVMCLFDLDCSAVFSGISPFDGMISPAYRVLSCEECMEPRYADYWFRYIFDGRKFNHYAKNIRYTLSYEEFSALPLLLPEKSEQRRIADYLDRKCSQIDAIIARQQEVIEKLKAYKLSVITEAVTKGLNPDVPMKDSGVEWIGNIPEDWEVSKLKFMGHFVNGYAFPSSSFTGDGVRVMKIANIQPMEISWIDESYVDVSEYEKLPMYRVEQGDLVFALTRPIINGGIKVAIFDGKEKVLLNQRNAMFKGLSRVLPRWMYYVMQNQMYVQKFALYIDGTGQQPNISTNEISQIEIPIPPIEVQQQVIMKLNEVMASIEKLTLLKERMIKQLSDYKKSLIYEVVTGKKAV